jgi:signal transduction histidine kinase
MKKEKESVLTQESLEEIAHQWRQPLSQINSIVGVIDRILFEKKIEDTQLEEKLQEIEELTKYMSETIDDFRANATKKEWTTLKDIVLEAISTVKAILKDHKIELNTKIDDDYDYKCNARQLTQILIVLLNNAKDALLERNVYEPKISVELLYEDGLYSIKVVDNAGGITKSVMKKIFESSYTTKHRSQGSGMGLSLARKIIEEHHKGSLSVRNVEEGSEFCINLPEVKEHE